MQKSKSNKKFFFFFYNIDNDLTNEERNTQKKLREVAREERDRGKRMKTGYRKIQINGEWFISD
jgi:hypothetical protein